MIRQQDKLVVVTRATRLEQLVARYNTWPQAKFYLQHMDLDPKGYEEEHETYQSALMRVRRELEQFDRPVQSMERNLVPNYIFGPSDVVITVGQDGLVVNTAKYLKGQKIVAINPDPARIDGILLPFGVGDFMAAVVDVLNDRAKVTEVTMAEVELNDGQRLLAFNDFLIGHRSHVSARYKLRLGNKEETQSSSGILVSTGAGSTGWLSSTHNMANALLQLAFAGECKFKMPKAHLSWNDPRLTYVVREPFASKSSGIEMTAGRLKPGQSLIVESQMGEGGVIFSDGMEADALQFNAGTVAKIQTAKDRAQLVRKQSVHANTV
jgi:NAD kinase